MTNRRADNELFKALEGPEDHYDPGTTFRIPGPEDDHTDRGVFLVKQDDDEWTLYRDDDTISFHDVVTFLRQHKNTATRVHVWKPVLRDKERR